MAFVLLGSSRLNFHCYTQREPTPTQKSARKWQLRPFAIYCAKDCEGQSLVQTSFTEPRNSGHTYRRCSVVMLPVRQGYISDCPVMSLAKKHEGERHGEEEEALDDLPWKDERGPSSVRRTLEPFQRQRWDNFWETELSASGLFRAHRYHLELNWRELNTKCM